VSASNLANVARPGKFPGAGQWWDRYISERQPAVPENSHSIPFKAVVHHKLQGQRLQQHRPRSSPGFRAPTLATAASIGRGAIKFVFEDKLPMAQRALPADLSVDKNLAHRAFIR
jgi:hypothetical protein